MKALILGAGIVCALPAAGLADVRCDFEGYEGFGRYTELTADERRWYAGSLGLQFIGTPDVHRTIREGLAALDLDPDRTPVVTADYDTGRLHVHYCAAEQCSLPELMGVSLLACRKALDTLNCLPAAIRVNGVTICTSQPGLMYQ